MTTRRAQLTIVMQMDWKLALVSLTILPFVFVPTVRLLEMLGFPVEEEP